MLRNTPLTLVFFFMAFVAPQFGVIAPLGYWTAIICLSAYTAAFVSEAVRSGINSVGMGQSEAARAIGLTFGQSLSLVILPQAVRSVDPAADQRLHRPGQEHLGGRRASPWSSSPRSGRRIALANPADTIWALIGVAVFYLLITIPAGLVAGGIERKVAFAR